MKILKLKLGKKDFAAITGGSATQIFIPITRYWINRLCKKYPPSVIAGGDLELIHSGIQCDVKKFDLVELSKYNDSNKEKATYKVASVGISEDTNEYFVVKILNEQNNATDGQAKY